MTSFCDLIAIGWFGSNAETIWWFPSALDAFWTQQRNNILLSSCSSLGNTVASENWRCVNRQCRVFWSKYTNGKFTVHSKIHLNIFFSQANTLKFTQNLGLRASVEKLKAAAQGTESFKRCWAVLAAFNSSCCGPLKGPSDFHDNDQSHHHAAMYNHLLLALLSHSQASCHGQGGDYCKASIVQLGSSSDDQEVISFLSLKAQS